MVINFADIKAELDASIVQAGPFQKPQTHWHTRFTLRDIGDCPCLPLQSTRSPQEWPTFLSGLRPGKRRGGARRLESAAALFLGALLTFLVTSSGPTLSSDPLSSSQGALFLVFPALTRICHFKFSDEIICLRSVSPTRIFSSTKAGTDDPRSPALCPACG